MPITEAFAHLQKNSPDDAQSDGALTMGQWSFNLVKPTNRLILRTIDKLSTHHIREKQEALSQESAKEWMARIAINYQAPSHPFMGVEYIVRAQWAKKHDVFGATNAWMGCCRLGLAVVDIGKSGIHFHDPYNDEPLVSYSTEPGKPGKWTKPQNRGVPCLEISEEEAYQAMLLLNLGKREMADPFTETLFLPESMTSQLQDKRHLNTFMLASDRSLI